MVNAQNISLSKTHYPSLVLVQPRKTRPCLTERLLMGCKESNKTNKQTKQNISIISACIKPLIFSQYYRLLFPKLVAKLLTTVRYLPN